MLADLKRTLTLCMITASDPQKFDEYLVQITSAIRGGVTMVQLREKGGNILSITHRARRLKSALKPLGVPLIVNDMVGLAHDIDADGVHLGQQDMSVTDARKMLGPNKIIGVSIESLANLEVCNATEGISYVTASSVFPSSTKQNCKTIWGLAGLKEIVRWSRYPVTAIGGINAENVAEIMAIGAVGIAVHDALHRVSDSYQAASHLKKICSLSSISTPA